MIKIQKYLEKKFSGNRDFVKNLKKNFRKIGVNCEHWERYPTYKQVKLDMANIDMTNLDVLEISAGEFWRENLKYNSFTSWNYPEYDICSEQEIKEKFDFIIADNVWEHLKYPYRATKNVHKLLKKNAYFLIIVPFLIRVHNVPIDCSRWTEDGLKYFLHDCGFELEDIFTNSWGNKKCVVSNLRSDDTWTRIWFHKDLKNDKKFPVQVWAIAKKK